MDPVPGRHNGPPRPLRLRPEHRRSTIRSSSPSPSTTPTSRSSATSASCSCRAAASDLQFMDIAATVNPATVHFRSLTEPSRVSVLEQNYEYDLLDPDKLLRKYVGRDVTLVRTRTGRRRDARRGSEGAAPQLQQRAGVADRRRDRDRPAGRSHQFPELPGNLYTRPTLIWTLDNTGGARRIASKRRISPASCRGTPTTCSPSRATTRRPISTAGSRSPTAAARRSSNAQLQLVAGDLNRVRQTVRQRAMEWRRRARDDGRGAAMAQESFSDYHLYTLGRKTTINNNETKQVSMLGGHRRPGAASATSSTARRSTTATRSTRARRSRTSCRSTTSSRTRSRPASACRCRPASCASTRPIRRAACSSSARIASTTRRRTRRCNLKIGNAFDVVVRAQADRLPEDRAERLRGRVRDHAAQPQDRCRSPSR